MKQPPILYGANVYGQRHEIAARRAYCRLQNLDLEYVEVPSHMNISTIRNWAHLDGFYISIRKHDGVIRIYRAIRIVTFNDKKKRRTRIIKLKRNDRFGFSHLKPGECVTYGPFFSTPVNYRGQWKKYIQYRVRALKKGSFEVIEREVQNFHDPIEFGTAYIIRRFL